MDVLDKGFAIRFFMSNHADKLLLKLLLEEIKTIYPEDLKINTVMNDDNNNG